MVTDSEIIFQILNREIDNILVQFGPLGNLVSGYAKSAIHDILSPYIEALSKDKKLDTEVATAFAKSQINEKVDKFMTEFEATRKKNGGGGNGDYLVS